MTVVEQATEVMCAIYRERVEVVVKRQVDAVKGGHQVMAIELYPPTPAEIQIVTNAIISAIDAGIHEAMGPIIDACDEWTAKDTKSAKARIEALLEEVRALKSSSLAVAG